MKGQQNRIELVTRPATRLPVLPPRGEVVQLRIEPVAPQCGLCGMRNRKNFYCVSCVQKGDFIHSGRGRGAGQQTLNPHGNLAEKKCNALRQATTNDIFMLTISRLTWFFYCVSNNLRMEKCALFIVH